MEPSAKLCPELCTELCPELCPELPIEIWRMIHFICPEESFGRLMLAHADLLRTALNNKDYVERYIAGRLVIVRDVGIPSMHATTLRVYDKVEKKWIAVRHGLCGNLRNESEYRFGEQHGRSIRYLYNTGIHTVTTYKNGIRHGIEKTYDKNECLIKVYNYYEGILQGEHFMLHANGNIKKQFQTDAKEKIYGLVQLFYTTGSIKIERHYKNNVRQGQYIEYRSNGDVHKSGNFYKGLEHGHSIEINSGAVVTCEWVAGTKVSQKEERQ
jgi:antitoxin component YwqK of YwqJK toxin-antitoxin module